MSAAQESGGAAAQASRMPVLLPHESAVCRRLRGLSARPPSGSIAEKIIEKNGLRSEVFLMAARTNLVLAVSIGVLGELLHYFSRGLSSAVGTYLMLLDAALLLLGCFRLFQTRKARLRHRRRKTFA